MSPRPHPILKPDSFPTETCSDLPFTRCGKILSPHVHFPPTPRMTSLRFTHSPHTYDRAPIVVSPNVCQLPKRGERKLHSPPVCAEAETRGRSYIRGHGHHRTEENVKGSYFHPRAYEVCEPEPLDAPPTPFNLPSLPPLVWSPSDESDDCVETPPGPNASTTLVSSLHPSPTFHEPTEGKARPLPPTAAVKGKTRRPGLVRQKTGRRAMGFSPSGWDEGCLGGF